MTLWYVSRATGLVALVLFTATMVLGTLTSGRVQSPAWARFAVAELHRNLSLLSVAFLTVHIATAVLDSYVSLRWVDVVVPFVSSYQPFWLGLGTLALDVLLAVLITSLLRTRMPLRAWRAVHWLSYLCWPIAVVHGFGMAEADGNRAWVLTLDSLCVLAVVIAVACRAFATHPDTEARKPAPIRAR
ncbi:ferric reductase-like transmembrane domain-containing protein [Amycolatopsis sp. H20-H5]|uniref:ferric reductase-like transmembrane domain-containing protein n=1 Tax=Amycolatopsis sp. H20-H5 TaxID=3046309 RepID=UPI002DB8C38D|nr:ferric reductase-like transmembrane domain-containing protein [Amycolatopsis sp. H20-H5]MEC3982701.1 ferric reductase-like transmembrane domain-containing protein [Amycolatopsis sp. H20-H5]